MSDLLKTPVTPGVQTFVRRDPDTPKPTAPDRTKEVVLPPGSATPGGAGRDIPKFENNTPDSDSNIQPRTLGVPGEEYGVPVKKDYNNVTRRTMTSRLSPLRVVVLAEYKPPSERGGKDGDRQREQSRDQQRKDNIYYRKNRSKIKRDNRRRYKQDCVRNNNCNRRRDRARKDPEFYRRGPHRD